MLILLLCLAQQGCQSVFLEPIERFDRVALENHWARTALPTSNFNLTSYGPATDQQASVLRVYIEGDGRSWLSRYRPSPDPSPIDPFLLEIAIADPSGRAHYLARPCQLAPADLSARCQIGFWTKNRYETNIIRAVSSALDRMKQAYGAEKLVLIGYSGGGVVSAHLAAQRTDVLGFVTLASPLDLDHWTTHHKVSALPESSNPARLNAELSRIPQHHFVGERDQNVTTDVLLSYVHQIDSSEGVLTILHGVSHGRGWQKHQQAVFERIHAIEHVQS